MVELIRRRPLVTFYVLAFVLGAVVTAVRLLDPGAMAAVFKDMRTAPWHPNIISVFPKRLSGIVAEYYSWCRYGTASRPRAKPC